MLCVLTCPYSRQTQWEGALKIQSIPLSQAYWLGRGLANAPPHQRTSQGAGWGICGRVCRPLCPGWHLVRVGMASPSLFPGVSSDLGLALVDMRCMSLEDVENHFISGADSVLFSKADGAGETAPSQGIPA